MVDDTRRNSTHPPLKPKNLTFAISAALAAPAGVVVAQDQDQDAAGDMMLEEVLVTARKRAESAMQIPESIQAWREFLVRAHSFGKVGIWGSGSKCVSFLRTLRAVDCVDMIVDINPHRRGRFAPGIPMSINTPDTCKEIDPDLIVVMNTVYEEEIRRELAEMGFSPRIASLGRVPR